MHACYIYGGICVLLPLPAAWAHMHKSKAAYYETRKSSIRSRRLTCDKDARGQGDSCKPKTARGVKQTKRRMKKGAIGIANSPLCIAYKRSFMLLESLLQQEPQQLPSQELQQHLQLQQALPRQCQESRRQTSSKEKCGDAQGRFP